MIDLRIEKYCESCPDFEPSVDKYNNGVSCELFTVITCVNEKRCRSLTSYLKERMKND
jgi:hypothetical protein